MKTIPLALFIASILLISNSLDAAAFSFSSEKSTSKVENQFNRMQFGSKQNMPIYSQVVNLQFNGFRSVTPRFINFPSLKVELGRAQLAPNCLNIQVANDVFITRCDGRVEFIVETRNFDAVQLRLLMATLIVTNNQNGYTFEVPLGFVREGVNQRAFQTGDLNNFDQWNVRVCSNNICRTAATAGRMAA